MHPPYAALALVLPLPWLVQVPVADDGIAAAAERTGFRGQVLIRCGDAVVYERAFGTRARDGGAPIDASTRFYVGSVSKTFTSTVVLQLVEEGRLALGDTLAERLSDVPDDKRAITLRQLLSHTGGLVANHPDPSAVLTEEEMVAWTLAQPLVAAPGARWSYSNPGYSLLAAIVERVDGGSFENSVRARVFEPAGMEGALFLGAEELAKGVAAKGEGPMVERFGLTGDPVDLPVNWQRIGPGAVLCTARDLLAFDRALRDEKLLPADMLALACTEVADDYGLGWRLSTGSRGEPVWWSDGAFPGFNAELFRNPEYDAAFVVLSAVEDGARALRGAVGARATACLGH